MECLVTGNNENIVNAKNEIKSELINCTGEDEILNFTTKVLPKLCYEKELIMDIIYEKCSNREVTDDDVGDEIMIFHGENCAERYRKANAWLYKIICIRQERKKLCTAINDIDSMIDRVFKKFEKECDISILKQYIKEFCMKDINNNNCDDISMFKQRIIEYCNENVNNELQTKNSKIHAELEIENDEELYKLMKKHQKCIEKELKLDYEEYVEGMDLFVEVNNYYISCFTACNDIYKEFNISVL
jgi:Lhr-like helicase